MLNAELLEPSVSAEMLNTIGSDKQYFCVRYIKKSISVSENNEEIENYAVQDHEILNTKEAT